MALAHRLSGIIRVATRWLRIISTNYISYVLISVSITRIAHTSPSREGVFFTRCKSKDLRKAARSWLHGCGGAPGRAPDGPPLVRHDSSHPWSPSDDFLASCGSDQARGGWKELKLRISGTYGCNRSTMMIRCPPRSNRNSFMILDPCLILDLIQLTRLD